MRYRELRSFVGEWKKIMHLQQWDINVHHVSADEMPEGPKDKGHLVADTDGVKSVAEMYINKDELNQRRTVLHELGHLILHELQPEHMTDAQEQALERAANRIERSFADLAGIPDEEEACGSDESGKGRSKRKRTRR